MKGSGGDESEGGGRNKDMDSGCDEGEDEDTDSGRSKKILNLIDSASDESEEEDGDKETEDETFSDSLIESEKEVEIPR